MIKYLIIILLVIKNANLSDISYYEILGVSKQASTQEIRQAYKKLAIKLHPDKNSNKDEQERFLKITEAYETLKDPDQRRTYDNYGTYPSYTRRYDYKSQAEYNNLYYNGLYHNDPFVDTVTGDGFYYYLSEELTFINFYSPFCPPCQNLVDHWKKLAEIYKGIIKVGAVNCKYHNSFCYNSMKIGSYPSLLFFPNGNNGNREYYRGGHNFEELEQFVMEYIRKKVHIPTLWQLRNVEKPTVYVVDNSLDENSLIRIAFQLQGLVSMMKVEDYEARGKLTSNPESVIVFRSKGVSKDIQGTNEKSILREIVDALPKLEQIDRDKLKQIRTALRSGAKTPWVLYFSKDDDDRLPLYQMRNMFPDMNFGEVNCSLWREVCASLQVEATPAWALLKRGGAYERAHGRAHGPRPRRFLSAGARARRLHTLSASDLRAVLDGEVGTWVLLVVPYQVSWDHTIEPFTQASLNYVDDDDINFGIMVCTEHMAHTEGPCGAAGAGGGGPAVLLQRGATRHDYSGRITEDGLVQFIQLLQDTSGMELSEQKVLEILDAAGREHTWLVAYLPANCGHFCVQLEHEWRLVVSKLRPLEFVKVGVLKCRSQSTGFCRNVRLPTGKLYPIASGQHYTANLQHISQAPYILEWALERIDDSVQKLNWNTFVKTVITEELNPGRMKPWLVYFHSPRCYRCYEMYPDFAILSIHLSNSMNFGKVNCLTDRSLCQHEHIMSYPSIKFYFNNGPTGVRSTPLQPKEYSALLKDIRAHLLRYDDNILAHIDSIVMNSQRLHFQHDEL